MNGHSGANKIRSLWQRWIALQVAADMLLSFAVALTGTSILFYWLNFPTWWAIPLFIISFALFSLLRKPWRYTIHNVCSFLNLHYPELEESAELVMKQSGSLNLLERLQLSKVENALQNVPDLPKPFTKRLKAAALWLLTAVAISFAIAKTQRYWQANGHTVFNKTSKAGDKALPPEKLLPQIEGVSLTITPPAYTGKPSRSQTRFTLDAEEGAIAHWSIRTNIAVNKATLIFNGKDILTLTGANSGKTEWKAQKAITQSGFYQVNINGKLSDLYQIQVIKDAAPVIHIKSPKQYTHIDAGEAPKVTLNATLSDDYGISNAMVFATVAKGSGEGVKFKEYQMPFAASFAQHSRRYDVQKLFDLPALNMEPGDELYFYIQATDNHQQNGRTDVYIVSIQDTAQLLSMDGLVAASNIKPEYFRSQRQIIIETEALIKVKDSLSTAAFNNKCNDLGIDQKMLRLRYGKFLGEEDESGTEGEGNEAVAKAENFGNAAVVMDAYTDKHDNAEDATFLEPAVKAQLKATLTEMWKAELRLRMYKPQDALPFEYKALRLLKDLQQKSRAYVAKTAYNPPPLKAEKRLSGELDKIIEPLNQTDVKAPADRFDALKKAVPVLEQLRYNKQITAAEMRILQLANQQLTAKASAEPNVYLPAIKAMRRILSSTKTVTVADVALVEKAIQRSLPNSKLMPQPAQGNSDMGLGQAYYKNLNR